MAGQDAPVQRYPPVTASTWMLLKDGRAEAGVAQTSASLSAVPQTGRERQKAQPVLGAIQEKPTKGPVAAPRAARFAEQV